MFTFLSPFRKGFSRKEALAYCSRRQGPTGLWEKLPELHYSLFNRGKEHLLKTDVELQAGKVNPSKKAIVLITDDATGQTAGLDLKDWGVDPSKGLDPIDASEAGMKIAFLTM
jgi:hypothetical protein